MCALNCSFKQGTNAVQMLNSPCEPTMQNWKMNEQLKNILPYKRIDELLSIGKEKSIMTADYFIKAGETPLKIAYVFDGLFRYVYTNDKGDEFTKAIIPENNFISSYSAMILNKPSYFAIMALENAQLLEIQWVDFNPSCIFIFVIS
jgi:hypothetical protein